MDSCSDGAFASVLGLALQYKQPPRQRATRLRPSVSGVLGRSPREHATLFPSYCYELNCVPPNTWNTSPLPLGMWHLFGNRFLAGDHVKMRLLEHPLIWYDWCPYKKGEIGHRNRRVRRKDDGTTQGECHLRANQYLSHQ